MGCKEHCVAHLRSLSSAIHRCRVVVQWNLSHVYVVKMRWEDTCNVHRECSKMSGIVISSRTGGAGIQIPAFWLQILCSFHPFPLLSMWCWSVTIIGFMLHSDWFLIIASLSWHMLQQRLSMQTPHPWQTLTRLQGSSGPLWGGLESCQCGRQAGSGRLVSHTVVTWMDLSWTDCSLERL